MDTNLPTFSWPIRVYYEDTDAAGVVYYANYLKFLERARTEWVRTLGISQERLATERGLRFAVSAVTMDFRAPARLDDLLTVDVALTEQRPASLLLQQRIVHERDGSQLLDATVRIVCVNHKFKPTRLPQDLFAKVVVKAHT